MSSIILPTVTAEDLSKARDSAYKPLNTVQRMNIRKDAGQTAYLRKCGYTVLRFWESDVNTDPGEVRKRILASLDEENIS